MEEKTYLKWHNKVGYGSGDIAGNLVYAFLSSFVMIYLTNTIGLNSGIVGTLIAVSKLFDGITDIFFGTMIPGCFMVSLAVLSRSTEFLRSLLIWVKLRSMPGSLFAIPC